MEFEKQTPMAVANYVITFANENHVPISNLQLQKVLYYLQAAFLFQCDQELFDGKFERWDYGPVQQEVYNAYRHKGAMMITAPSPQYSLSNGKFNGNSPETIDEEILKNPEISSFLVKSLRKLLAYNPWDLVKKTHKQSLWLDYEVQINGHIAPQYDNEEIKEYFKSDINKKERLWQEL